MFDNKIKFHLTIIGSYDKNNPNNISKELFNSIKEQENITYIKFDKNISKYFNNIDCAILPSSREGMPRFLLEASSYGIPLIGSNVTGINELIVEGYNGLLFDLNDFNSLKKVVLNFINLKIKEKQNLGLNARKIIEAKFSSDIVINSYLKKINEI
tara:strand:- start:14 stop:481 length:468 start_codon:yes stop_codon:yes gene_type:complete